MRREQLTQGLAKRTTDQPEVDVRLLDNAESRRSDAEDRPF